MNARPVWLFALFAIAAGAVTVCGQVLPSIQPKEGYVPNEATAVAIGEAVMLPIWGEASIARHRPYRATLTDGVWRVEGTLPPGTAGGTAIALVSRDDGRIVRVFHEQ